MTDTKPSYDSSDERLALCPITRCYVSQRDPSFITSLPYIRTPAIKYHLFNVPTDQRTPSVVLLPENCIPMHRALTPYFSEGRISVLALDDSPRADPESRLQVLDNSILDTSIASTETTFRDPNQKPQCGEMTTALIRDTRSGITQ